MRAIGGSKVGVRRASLGLVGGALSLLLMVPATAGTPDDDGLKKPGTGAKKVAVQAAKASGGNVTISGWATFSGQIMAGRKDPDNDAEPQVIADANGAEIIGSDFIYRPENEDFFWRIEVTKIPTVSVGVGSVAPLVGSTLTRYTLRFVAKGKEYEIRAHNLGVNVDDPLSAGDHVFGLFRCGDIEGQCDLIQSLKGGYGTTGERIVVALPLEVLKEAGANVKEGDKIGVLLAHTANAAYLGPPPRPELIWDEVRLTRNPEETVPKKSVRVTVGKTNVNANLKDGYFDAKFRRSLFKKSPTTVKTRTCLGKDCKNQTFKVKA